MQTIVIDPGHGGSEAAGGSSANNAVGPNGMLEKDVALDLGRRVAMLLSESARVVLTRNDDSNLSLTERARVAADNDAALFASIHLNGFADAGVDGVEAWVARGANERSKRLALALVDRIRTAAGLADRGVKEADFGVLKTERHDPETGACLLEVAFLTNPDEARRLESDEYKQRLAQAIAEALASQLGTNGAADAGTAPAVAKGLEVGQGSPLADQAVDHCWERLKELRANATAADAPNRVSAELIRSQTGLTMERNPYWGITRQELEAVVRAGYESHQLPEVLLALWAKEGSTESLTSPMSIPQASSEANARTIARSIIYFQHLGSDYFIDTTRPDPAGDNTWDPSDAAAPQNEQRFVDAIRGLVTDGQLSEDLSDAINAELSVSTDSAGHFAVQPTTRFYTLSLLAMDALFTKWLDLSYPELPAISVPMNYLQWNMGTGKFATFLQSAERHRAETRFPDAPIPLEQWALETQPRRNEYRVPRTNAIRFKHYVESYRPVFQGAMSLIKPGIEDLVQPRADAASVARQLGTPQDDAVALVDEFRARGGAGAFTPGRSEVADRLVQLIQNPALVDQASLNLCGPAAFHRVWIPRDPVAFARYAISLYETGAGNIGTLHVDPASDLKEQDYTGTAVPAMKARAPAGANQAEHVCPAAEWVTMSSLRDVANAFFDYEGMPDEEFSAATTPGEVAEWLQATGLYSSVADEGNWFFTKGLNHALGLRPGPTRDVILLVNAHLLTRSSKKKSDDFILRAFPNHFIVLDSRITEASDGKVAFDYWSWGDHSHIEVPKDVFNANYYGAVTGEVRATAQQASVEALVRAAAEPEWHPPQQLPIWGVPSGRVGDGFLHQRRNSVHLGIDVYPDLRGDRSANDPRRGWPVYATPRATLDIDRLNSSAVKAATKGADNEVTVQDGIGIPGNGTAVLRDVRVLRQPWTDRSDHSYGGVLGIACRYAYTDPAPGVFTIYVEYLHLITADFPPKDAGGTVIADWSGESGFGPRLPDGALLSGTEVASDNPILVGYLGATQSPHVHINAAYAQGERGYVKMPRIDPREVLVDHAPVSP
jgi:N-acetylmuramoyl-L-alanine amidase